jgi:hypothetical protein
MMAGARGIAQGHGQGDDDQQGVELGGLSETGVLDVEATGFAVAEETFDLPAPDLPAPALGLESLLGGAIAGDDQELSVAELFGGEKDRRFLGSTARTENAPGATSISSCSP